MLPTLVQCFLFLQTHGEGDINLDDIPIENYPQYTGKVRVFTSAVATFFAPSDPSGVGGMRRERIRATRSWRRGAACNDCIFVVQDADLPGFQGLLAA